ncbi:MAG: hypothetical protein ABW252_16650 [Polyangiales bacterium]
MSNIAGKAYAMNLVTPLRGALVFVNKLIFRMIGTRTFRKRLDGLLTLSMIHYARWVILRAQDFPRLSDEQPRETLRYGTMFFFSNFNGSWEQYVDSFSAAIPSGLDLLWYMNVGWPRSVPEQPFHRYVEHNQLWTDYYYSAYPMAAANDVKAAQRVKRALGALVAATADASPEAFKEAYDRMLNEVQGDLGELDASPIVSLAAEGIAARRRGVSVSVQRAQTRGNVARLRDSVPPSGSDDESEISGVTEIAGGEVLEQGTRGGQRRAQ